MLVAQIWRGDHSNIRGVQGGIEHVGGHVHEIRQCVDIDAVIVEVVVLVVGIVVVLTTVVGTVIAAPNMVIVVVLVP